MPCIVPTNGRTVRAARKLIRRREGEKSANPPTRVRQITLDDVAPGAAYLSRMTTTSLLAELEWRGLLYQQTEGLAAALAAGPVPGYIGFDPTGPSLHVGHLVPVMTLVHLQRAGHPPIALVGGGTGLIGDPSGKASERQLLTAEATAENARGVRQQLERFLDFGGLTAARVMDNAEWLGPMPLIDFLRDVGKYFPINVMLAKESVRSRLDAGISFTEFAYMLLQAYDFLELHRRAGVRLQLGGSDQWGNMTAGTELIRRSTGADAHALTVPLLTTASGTKFGKTEAGAVWLDAARTSPYAFYQFWINADDRDVSRYLRFFTLLSRPEIEQLDRLTSERAAEREAQRTLARDVTARVHGAAAVRAAEEVSQLLFGKGDPHALSREALAMLRREIAFAEHHSGDGVADVLDLLVATGLAASKGAAKRLIEQGGVSVSGRKVTMGERTVVDGDLLADRHLLLRKGARDWALVRLGA